MLVEECQERQAENGKTEMVGKENRKMTNTYYATKRILKQINSLDKTRIKGYLEDLTFDSDYYDVTNVNPNIQTEVVECLYGGLDSHLDTLKFYLEGTLAMLEDF